MLTFLQEHPHKQGAGVMMPMLERVKGMFGRGGAAGPPSSEAANGPPQNNQGYVEREHCSASIIGSCKWAGFEQSR
eukprot:1161489-Pelagomonas_calceolata.AAC.1